VLTLLDHRVVIDFNQDAAYNEEAEVDPTYREDCKGAVDMKLILATIVELLANGE